MRHRVVAASAAAVGALALGLAAHGHAQAQVRDVCAVLEANPTWADTLEIAAERWGISAGTILAVLDQESRLKPHARGEGAVGASPSRNYGFAQANLRTWNWFVDDTGIEGGRSDFTASAHFVGWHFATFERRIRQPRSDTYRHYLAYKLGEGGYRSGASAASQAIARRVADRAIALDADLSACPR